MSAVSVILLVEDDPALRRALRTTLRSRDFEVLEAATGEAAIVIAADGRPDVVILDLGLPDLDGLDVLRRLRTFSDVPVIVLTARDEQSEKVRSLDAGADDYVTKPFDTEELLARIRAALRRVPHAVGAARRCSGSTISRSISPGASSRAATSPCTSPAPS